jgi:hypothetical protein
MLVTLALAPAARAEDISAAKGSLTATLRVVPSDDGRGRPGELVIERNGKTLFDKVPSTPDCLGDCSPLGLEWRDLDSDGEPELLYHVDTGLPHCCHVIQVFRLRADRNGYRSTAHNFLEGPTATRDLNGDGRTEFITADAAFQQFRLASGKNALPIHIYRYDRVRFTDVTRSYRGRLRAEASRFLSTYRRTRGKSDGSWFAPLMAWAADEYRLGHRKAVLAFLRREAKHGHLAGRFETRRALIKFLDGYLLGHDYK